MTTTATPTDHPLLGKHADALAEARAALAARSYYSRYPESPSPRVYGETAAADGLAAHEAHLGGRYAALADQPTDGTWVGVGGLALRAGPRGRSTRTWTSTGRWPRPAPRCPRGATPVRRSGPRYAWRSSTR